MVELYEVSADSGPVLCSALLPNRGSIAESNMMALTSYKVCPLTFVQSMVSLRRYRRDSSSALQHPVTRGLQNLKYFL